MAKPNSPFMRNRWALRRIRLKSAAENAQQASVRCPQRNRRRRSTCVAVVGNAKATLAAEFGELRRAHRAQLTTDRDRYAEAAEDARAVRTQLGS